MNKSTSIEFGYQQELRQKNARISALEAEVERLKALVLDVANIPADDVDNGYCMICGRHRSRERDGPGPCENPKCISHEVRKLRLHPTPKPSKPMTDREKDSEPQH